MKFVINRGAFQKAIGALSKVVEKRNTVPILANVAIQASDGELRLAATDLDLELTTTIEADIRQQGSATVSASLLFDILRKGGDDTVEVTKDTNNLEVKIGRSKFKLQWLPITDWPSLTAGAFTHYFEANSAAFKNTVDAVAFAVSTEETRYYLNGIYFHAVEDPTTGLSLRCVATDGHRLAQAQIGAPAEAKGMPGIIIPRKTCGEILKLLPDDGDVSIAVSDSKIRFVFGSTVLTSKLIDGTFPDYTRVTPKPSETVAKIKVDEFVSSVDRVTTISSARGRAVKLTFTEGRVLMLVNNPDSGEATDDVGCDWSHDDLSIGFNGQYLQDAMRSLNADEVDLFLIDAGAPALIKPTNDTQRLVVLMPMRV